MASPNYVEYQHSAPEFNVNPPEKQGPVAAAYYSGYDYKPPPPPGELEGEGKGKRKFLGMAPWMFFTLLVLALLVVVGIVIGAVLGTKHARENDKAVDSSPASSQTASLDHVSSQTASSHAASSRHPTATASPTRTASASATESDVPTATSTAFTVIQAIYAAVDITDNTDSWHEDDNLVIDMDNTDPWGTPDPWFGNKKCLSLLFSTGNTTSTFVACEGDGKFTFIPGETLDHTNEITETEPTSASFAIVSVVWGAKEITSEDVYQGLYDSQANGASIALTNDVFGEDTLFGTAKSAVIWYTEDGYRTFQAVYGRENDEVTF